MAPAPFETGMNHRENAGYEKQGSKSCEQKTADDRAAERSILFAAFAETESHGHHADDHGERGHDDWTNADEAGLERGFDGAFAFGQLFAGEGDHEDAVGGGYTHAHDGASE